MNWTRTRLIQRVLIVFGFCLVTQAGAYGKTGPQQVIQDTSERLRVILQENKQRLVDEPEYVYRLADEVFVPHVDMERVSSLVLGKHWRRATPEQKQAFSDQFKRMLVRTYATALRELGDWKVDFLPMRTQPGEKRVLVQTLMTRSGAPPVAMDYRMHQKDGHWLAFDVSVEGVSLITNYRASFSRLIRQKGIDGLIKELAARNEQGQSLGEPVAANMVAR